ncbi:type I-E CRISPR-associated protein Cse1/CasA [Nocardia takedensis]
MTTTRESPPVFDLLEQPWIIATDPAGRVELLSLREVLTRPQDFTALGGDVATQEFAILRLLSAIVHRAVAARPGTAVQVWSTLWQQWPHTEIQNYLDAHRHRFRLFDPVAPFMQVPGLRSGKDAVSSLDKLIADVPNGVKYFTTRAGRAIERIGFGEAARWLVHAHAFDPSGIKTGADGDDRVKGGRGYPIGVAWAGALGGIYLEGTNLRETLLLNLVLANPDGARHPATDLPPWERDPDGPAVRADPHPRGPVDLFTWQSRRIRLVGDDKQVSGVVLCNGDALQPYGHHRLEPMSAWRYSEIQSKKAGTTRHYPRTHDPDKSLWRGLRALLDDIASTTPLDGRGIAAGVTEWAALLQISGMLAPSHPIRLHAVGMHYINNQSIVGDIVDDTIGFPAALLARDRRLRVAAINAVKAAENAVDALGSLAADLATAAGGTADNARARAREEGFFACEAPYRAWLRDLAPTTDLHAAAARWERAVHKIVTRHSSELIETAGKQAWIGRAVGKEWLDASAAEYRFDRLLRKAVPAAFTTDTPTPERPKTDDASVTVAW